MLSGSELFPVEARGWSSLRRRIHLKSILHLYNLDATRHIGGEGRW